MQVGRDSVQTLGAAVLRPYAENDLGAGQAVVVVEDHQDEGGDDDYRGDPPEGLGDALLAGVDRLAVCEQTAKQEAGRQASTVGPTVNA